MRRDDFDIKHQSWELSVKVDKLGDASAYAETHIDTPNGKCRITIHAPVRCRLCAEAIESISQAIDSIDWRLDKKK